MCGTDFEALCNLAVQLFNPDKQSKRMYKRTACGYKRNSTISIPGTKCGVGCDGSSRDDCILQRRLDGRASRWSMRCSPSPRYSWTVQRSVVCESILQSRSSDGTCVCVHVQARMSEHAFRLVMKEMLLPEQHVDVLVQVCA